MSELSKLLTKRNCYFVLLGLVAFGIAYFFDRYYILGEKDHILARPLEIFFRAQ